MAKYAGNLLQRADDLRGTVENFGYDGLNRLRSAGSRTFDYDEKGNLKKKGEATLDYGGSRPHAVTSAMIKGFSRNYAYDDAGYVTSDGKRSDEWTSYGQLSKLTIPSLRNSGTSPAVSSTARARLKAFSCSIPGATGRGKSNNGSRRTIPAPSRTPCILEPTSATVAASMATAPTRDMLATAGMSQSMSARTNPYHNAWNESFMGALKIEILQVGEFAGEKEALIKIFDSIESYNNHHRKHSFSRKAFFRSAQTVAGALIFRGLVAKRVDHG